MAHPARPHPRTSSSTRNSPAQPGAARVNLGFTLGEMTTAMSIAGIVAAVALPACGNLYMNMRVKSVAAEFAADLRYARAEAVSRRTAVQVTAVDERGWRGGWLVRDASRVLLDRTGLSRVFADAPVQTRLTYTITGTLTQAGSYAVLFHAPDFRWVQPRCVYVGPDGRPGVELPLPTGNCRR